MQIYSLHAFIYHIRNISVLRGHFRTMGNVLFNNFIKRFANGQILNLLYVIINIRRNDFRISKDVRENECRMAVKKEQK